MTEHAFILTQSEWLGEGTINLSMVEEPLKYHTKWKISERDEGGLIECVQEVQLKGMHDVMINQFTFFDFGTESFKVILENNTLGKIEGKGIIGPDVFGWEFKNNDLGFQGFEFYEKQEKGVYVMHAEFTSSDDYRTLIKGKIWKKEPTNTQKQEDI